MHGDAATGSQRDGIAAAPDDQIAYTVKHAAKVMDLGERTVWDLVMSGDIESFKVGRSRRIARVALVAYMKSRQVRPDADDQTSAGAA